VHEEPAIADAGVDGDESDAPDPRIAEARRRRKEHAGLERGLAP
jgi:hypothetical protein